MIFYKKKGCLSKKMKTEMTEKKVKWLWGVSIGLLLMVVGFMSQQYQDIYRKAIMICLECIGIG